MDIGREIIKWYYVEVPTCKIFKEQVGWVYNDETDEFLSEVEHSGKQWVLSTLAFNDDITSEQMSCLGFEVEDDAALFKLRFG